MLDEEYSFHPAYPKGGDRFAKDTATATNILEKVDEEARQRKLGKSFWGRVTTIVAITLSLFHLYTAARGILPAVQQRTFHRAYSFPGIFIDASNKEVT